jgi:hypothetical protein
MGLVRGNCGMMVLVLDVRFASAEGLEDLHDAGYDFVFLRIFLLGDAFFFPLLFMIGSTTSVDCPQGD